MASGEPRSPLSNKGHNIHVNACIIERIAVCPASPFRLFAPEWGRLIGSHGREPVERGRANHRAPKRGD